MEDQILNSLSFILTIYADAVNWLERHLLTCPSKKYLHMDCPGCGLQRSFIYLLKGDLAASLQMYPATIPIFLMFCYLTAHLMFKFRNGARNLTFLFLFCAGIIAVHYIYKVVTFQNF